MAAHEIRVVLDQPFDWIGSVLVPSASVLISAGVALGLLALERRAARRDSVRGLLANLIQQLNGLSSATHRAEKTAELEVRVIELFATANVLEMRLKRRDWALPDFVCTTLALAERSGREELGRTASWLMHVIKGWEREWVTSADLTRNMPLNISHSIHDRADPMEWVEKTGYRPEHWIDRPAQQWRRRFRR